MSEQIADYVCDGCGKRVGAADAFDYHGQPAHLLFPVLPYYSADGQGLPCGPLVRAHIVSSGSSDA